MSKLYAVFDYEYDYRHIIALCSTREAAERIYRIFDNPCHCPEIKEYEDGASADYCVWWEYDETERTELPNGDVLLFSLKIDYGRDEERVWRDVRYPEKLHAEFKAKDEDHAKKKLFDMIAEFKANEAGID